MAPYPTFVGVGTVQLSASALTVPPPTCQEGDLLVLLVETANQACTLSDNFVPTGGGGSGSPVEEQTKTDSVNNITSLGIAFDTTPTTGNLLVAIVAIDKASGTITPPSGWTTVVEYTGGTGVSGGIYTKVADGTNPTNTWTWSATLGCTIVLKEFSLSGGGTPSVVFSDIDTTNASTTARTTGELDGGSTAYDNTYVLVAAMNDTYTSFDGGAKSWTNGYTNIELVGNIFGEPGIQVGYKEIATAGGSTATTFSYTGDSADEIMGVMIGIAAVGGGSEQRWTECPGSPVFKGTTAGAAGSVRLTAYYSFAANSTPGDTTVDDSGNHQVAQILAIRGVAQLANGAFINAYQDFAHPTATSNISAPSVTTTKPYCYILNALATDKDLNDTDTITSWVPPSDARNGEEILDRTTSLNTGGGIAAYGYAWHTPGPTGNTFGTGDNAISRVYLTLAFESDYKRRIVRV